MQQMSAPLRVDALKRLNMLMSLFAVILLNLVDSFFTIVFVDVLGFQEMNPIVAPIFNLGPLAFISWKMSMVVCCCLVIYTSWSFSRKKWVQQFVNALMVIYGILALTHMAAMVRLIV